MLFYTQEEAQVFLDSLEEVIFDIPLNEFVLRTGKHRDKNYLFRVDVDFPEKEIPIDPWMIGYWLGDRNSSGAGITTAAIEVVEYFNNNLQFMDLINQEYRYNIKSIGKSFPGCNMFLNALRDLDMINSKRIPDLYKLN